MISDREFLESLHKMQSELMSHVSELRSTAVRSEARLDSLSDELANARSASSACSSRVHVLIESMKNDISAMRESFARREGAINASVKAIKITIALSGSLMATGIGAYIFQSFTQ